jgi:hypothetical protein
VFSPPKQIEFGINFAHFDDARRKTINHPRDYKVFGGPGMAPRCAMLAEIARQSGFLFKLSARTKFRGRVIPGDMSIFQIYVAARKVIR